MSIQKKSVIISSLLIIFFMTSVVFAAGGPLDLLKQTGQAGGYSAGTNQFSLSAFVGSIVFILLSLLGVIFLVLTVFAGYLWFTAGGDEKKVEKAQSYLKNGVIGLIVIIASLSITNFLVFRLIWASSGI